MLTVVEVVEEGCGTGAGAAVGGGSGSAAPLWSRERKTPCGLRKICEGKRGRGERTGRQS